MDDDITPESFYHNVSPNLSNIFCYQPMMSTSSGVWLGDNPLNFSFPLLLFQIAIIFAATRLTHALLRHLDIPAAISQIIGGMLLGPSFLGHSRAFESTLFSKRSWEQLNTISLLSFVLFYFVVGVKADLSMILKTGRKVFAISILSTFLPIAGGILAYHLMKSLLPEKLNENDFFISLGTRWSVTSYAVLSCTLEELHLLTSKLGRIALSAALIGDFASVFVRAIFTAYNIGYKEGSPLLAIANFSNFIGIWIFILLVARPLSLWMIRRTPEGRLMEQGSFLMVVVMALLSSLISEMMGYHLVLGPFMLGLLLPGGAPLGVTMVERLDRLTMGVFLPVFMASAGLRMDLGSLVNVGTWGWGEVFVVLLLAVKIAGVMLPCLYCKMPLMDSFSVGLMMNTKGIYEVNEAVQWQDSEVVDPEVYTSLILSIIIIGGGTAPLVKYLYRPEDRFFSHRRRTVQHCKNGEELRILASIHNQDNVSPIVSLIATSHATRHKRSSICVYILHLINLVGRSATILFPHEPHPGAPTTETDHIVNAFAQLERLNPGRISILPYVCISPYATMHDDVCSLALDKKTALIILPFHRHSIASLAGAISVEPAGPSAAVRTLNMNVLSYAPCSVGILINHGLSWGGGGGALVQHVGMYFFGGADDREALAIVTRMTEELTTGVTVVRFRSPKEQRRVDGREERMDEEAVVEFREGAVDGKRVVFREEAVRDVEGTVEVIRSMEGTFSLVVVGRREGHESVLTSGLSAWSEYLELGVVGDLLASTDFAGWVSTLVVQQQRRYVAGWELGSPRGGYIRNQIVLGNDNEEEVDNS